MCIGNHCYCFDLYVIYLINLMIRIVWWIIQLRHCIVILSQDIYCLTIFFSPKKNWVFHFFGLKKKLSKFFLSNYYATFQCGRYSIFKKIFDPEKVKKRASKVAHNRPNSFFFTVQPRPQPTAQN